MITGELKNKIDRIWDAFWSGGISNPIEVIEQITYLLFLRRLDDLHTRQENRANRLNKPIQDAIFPIGQNDLRWSTFKHFEPAIMFQTVDERVFPFWQCRNISAKSSAKGGFDVRPAAVSASFGGSTRW